MIIAQFRNTKEFDNRSFYESNKTQGQIFSLTLKKECEVFVRVRSTYRQRREFQYWKSSVRNNRRKLEIEWNFLIHEQKFIYIGMRNV